MNIGAPMTLEQIKNITKEDADRSIQEKILNRQNMINQSKKEQDIPKELKDGLLASGYSPSNLPPVIKKNEETNKPLDQSVQDIQKVEEDIHVEQEKQNSDLIPSIDPSKLNVKKLSISENDKDNLFVSIVDEVPYTETIELYPGRMDVVFRTLNVEEIKIVQTKLAEEDIKLSFQYDVLNQIYLLCFALVKTISKQKVEIFDKGSFDDRLKRIKQFSSPKFVTMIESLGSFNMKVAEMNKEIKDKNFL